MPHPHAPREYRGDFEVHLTASAASPAVREALRAWCAAAGCKCVWIVLARGAHADQPMATWRRRASTLSAVRADAEARAADLAAGGVPVTRIKVEAPPSNADLPQTDADAANHPPSNYFEHHAKLLRPAAAPRDALLSVCATFGAHLSRNAFRDAPDGFEERFVTLRTYGVGAVVSNETFAALLAALRDAGERVLEHESEYCVYDSAIALDAGWLEPVG